MTGNRPFVFRLALLATCVAAFSSLALITPGIFAQETSSTDQIHQACLEHLNSWIFKSGDSNSCQCDQCSECGERCAKADTIPSSTQQNGPSEQAAWTKLCFVDDREPTGESCAGACCTQTDCDKSDCCDDKLGMIGFITEPDCLGKNSDAADCQSACVSVRLLSVR